MKDVIEYHQKILEDIWLAVELETRECATDGFKYQSQQLEIILDELANINFEEE